MWKKGGAAVDAELLPTAPDIFQGVLPDRKLENLKTSHVAPDATLSKEKLAEVAASSALVLRGGALVSSNVGCLSARARAAGERQVVVAGSGSVGRQDGALVLAAGGIAPQSRQTKL